MTKQALVLMDFQNGIISKHPDEVVTAAARAADTARAAGVPVVFVRVAFRPGYPEVAGSNKRFGAIARTAADAMTIDHPGTQIHTALAVRDDEPVVVKKRFSAFAGSDLDVVLRGIGAEHLVLAGVSTSGVVLSTVRYAADLDYRLTVLADACSDGEDEVHRVLVEKVFPLQAEVTSVGAWTASLRS